MISKRLSRIRRSLETVRKRQSHLSSHGGQKKPSIYLHFWSVPGRNILKANLGSHWDFQKSPDPQRAPTRNPSALPSANKPLPSPTIIHCIPSNIILLLLIRNEQLRDTLIHHIFTLAEEACFLRLFFIASLYVTLILSVFAAITCSRDTATAWASLRQTPQDRAASHEQLEQPKLPLAALA